MLKMVAELEVQSSQVRLLLCSRVEHVELIHNLSDDQGEKGRRDPLRPLDT
jgi:hypothetical protein